MLPDEQFPALTLLRWRAILPAAAFLVRTKEEKLDTDLQGFTRHGSALCSAVMSICS